VAAGITDIRRTGIAIPIQKAMRIAIFSKKSAAVTLSANKRMTGAGLQGRMIRPKKRPNINAFPYGPAWFDKFGVGIILERSISKIRHTLAPARIINAIMEIIPVATLNEDRNIQVKIKPTTRKAKMSPAVTMRENRKSNVLSFRPATWFASHARYPG